MHTYIHGLSWLLPTSFPSELSLPLTRGLATLKKLNQNVSDMVPCLGPWCFCHLNSQVLPTADAQLSQGPPDIAQVFSWCQQTGLRNSWKGGSLCLPRCLIPSSQALPSPQCRPTPTPLTDLHLPAPTPGAARGHSCCPFPLPQIPWLYVPLIHKPSSQADSPSEE